LKDDLFGLVWLSPYVGEGFSFLH